MFTSEHTRERL